MNQSSVPRYHGLRIYLSTTLLYLFLIIPFMFFLAIQNIPQLMESQQLRGGPDEEATDSTGMGTDSLSLRTDSLARGTGSMKGLIRTGEHLSQEQVDSLVEHAIALGEEYADSLKFMRPGSPVQVSVEEEGNRNSLFEEKGPFAIYFRMLFPLILISYLAGLIFNIRFKRYFKRKRKGKEVSERLVAYCRKDLLKTPLVNSLILTFPNVFIILYSVFFILPQGQFDGEMEKKLFIQFFFLTIVSTLLIFLFVYYWQKHRVHIRYIDHLFSADELRKQIFRRPGGKIRNRLMIASAMTTFLPLMVVMVYLILSLSAVRDLDLDALTLEQREILIGDWVKILHQNQTEVTNSSYERFYYVNAIDTLIMLVGIGTGIMVSFFYILLFIRWTNMDITRPVKELLSSIRETRTGEGEHYTIVRTNDEIGELAEGYNEMTEKIHEYVQSISKMNRELEEKVKERTEEILEQKEEIEAQKEEIEAQLDLTTRQRDTISSQKELILDSIRYAERIQKAILPPLEQLAGSVTDHFILFKPRDIVSGDYYWTTRKGDQLLIAVADCTGHGVPGAFLSMLGISSLNEIVNRNNSIRPGEILEFLRNFVIHSLHQTGSRGETRDGIEIALCVIDLEKRTMQFSGANRSLYLIRRNSGTGKGSSLHGGDPAIRPREETDTHRLIQIDGDRMPIGIYEQDPLPFSNRETELEDGDVLYLFSDGYVDQLGGASRKTFRSRRFRRLLLQIQEKPMEDQKKILDDRLARWRGKIEQIDDILVVGIKL